MIPTHVDDSENLYRSIRCNSDEYKIDNDDGSLRFSVSAFNDRDCKPSVDRSSLRPDPKDARRSVTDGVTKVVTKEVRKIGNIPVKPDRKGEGGEKYAVDVFHRPVVDEPVNLAHCQIECAPDIAKTHFKKLKEALARIAEKHGFIVRPAADDQTLTT